MPSKQEDLRRRIVQFYQQHKSEPKSYTVSHFMAENVPKRTIYNVIKHMAVERKFGSGRKATIMTKANLAKLRKLFNNKDGISQRDAGRKFECTQQHIGKSLQKLGIHSRKKQRSPAYTESQIAEVKKQCLWLVRNYREKSFVLDDESYFGLSRSHVPGNDIFYSDNISDTPVDVRYKQKAKFEPKVMLYIAISEKGVSKPWFKPSRVAVTQEVYENQCLKKILIPFLREHHSECDFVFWPDKASAHYAKRTQEFLTRKNIPFVPKERNPTNLPQCRPVEDLFGKLASEVYKNNWKASNLRELKNRIRLCLRKMDMTGVQRSCKGIRTSLRRVAEHGPFYENH